MTRSAYESRLRRAEESLRLLEFNARKASDEIGKFAQDVALFNPGWGYGQETTSIHTGLCGNPFPLTLYAYNPLMSRTQLDWDNAEQAWLGCGTFTNIMPFYFMANSTCTAISPAGATSQAVIRFQKDGYLAIFYLRCPSIPPFSGPGACMAEASCPASLGGMTPFGPNTFGGPIPPSAVSCSPISVRYDFSFLNSTSTTIKDV
ncbi:hypothetical protein [Singulisphaera sp. PoT]|uniref:hypothetical protein n=1 Tax=Singulisphaera sp. PoT TaxID=3411797 RepID=UPI003BF521FA